MSWFKRLFGHGESESSSQQSLGSDTQTPIARVTARVIINGNPEDSKVPTPLLTLEEFFEGNEEIGSIGCNLDGCPEPNEFFKLLSEIRSRPDVSDVRVQITCLDDPWKQWPFSDTLWIMTPVDAETVKTWFPTNLAPDECWTGWTEGTLYEPIEVIAGHSPVAAWFD
jgi:hypothetical protein